MPSTDAPKPARKKRPWWASLIKALCGVIVVVGGCFIFLFGGLFAELWMRSGPGPFERKNMEAIVEQVRLTQMKPGEEKDFKLDHLSDPKSLHPFRAPCYGNDVGHVWARMSSEGWLTVVIETNDMGHAGSFGFAYSDLPLADSHGRHLNVPGMLNEPRKKIDEHWWEVQYSLG
jgi:hypothetical protein